MNFSVRTGGTQEDWHLVRKEKITYYAIVLMYLVPFYSAEYVGNRPADIANKYDYENMQPVTPEI